MPPRIPGEKFSWGYRRMRQKLLPWGVFFNDHRVFVTRSMLDELRKGKYDNRAGRLNEAIYEFGGRNPWLVVDALRRLMGMFSIVAFILDIAITVGKPHVSSLSGWLFFLTFFTLYLLLTLLQRYTPYHNNCFLNRRTGMVVIPKGKDRGAWTFPFDEADAHIQSNATQNGTTVYSAGLHHRYSLEFMGITSSEINTQHCNFAWEFIQHFMDISKPLPDVPQLEPYRHLDPVTAQYDKEHNRPKDYWRNKDPNEVNKEWGEAHKRGMKFPFGAMRDKMEPYLTAEPLPDVQETPSISQEELNAILEPYKKYTNIR